MRLLTLCLTLCLTPAAAMEPELGSGLPSTALLDEPEVPFVAPSSATVHELAAAYTQEYRSEHRLGFITLLARTPPASIDDLRWLTNIYERGDPLARRSAEESLRRISPSRSDLAPFLLSMLEQDDPFFHAFAIAGLSRLRYAPALPLIRKAASGDFPQPEPTLSMPPTDAARWSARYQALDALARWEGASVLPLLLRKSEQAPRVAGLASSLLWEQALPQVLRWSESNLALDQDRARAAWSAPVDLEKLKPTLPLLRTVMLDKKKKMETRRQAAVRVGIGGSEEDIDGMLKRLSETKDKTERLLLSAALFASRNPKAIPLLVEHVKTNPEPTGRAGALVQLKTMMQPPEYRELLLWVSQNDKDAENRDGAVRELAELK